MYEDRLPTEPVFSAKAIVTGGLASLCIAIGSPYGNMVIRGSYLSIDFSTAGALFLFFLLTGFLMPSCVALPPHWHSGAVNSSSSTL